MHKLPKDHPLEFLVGTITQVGLEKDGTVWLYYDDGKILCIYEDDEGQFTLGFPEGHEA